MKANEIKEAGRYRITAYIGDPYLEIDRVIDVVKRGRTLCCKEGILTNVILFHGDVTAEKMERIKMKAVEVKEPGIYLATVDAENVCIRVRVSNAFGKLVAHAEGVGVVSLNRVREDMEFEKVAQ